MIDQLLRETRSENWQKVSQLLFRHWTLEAHSSFLPVNADQPWENLPDERISDKLLQPLLAMFSGAELDPISNSSLKSLKIFAPYLSANHKQGQICGRVFKYGEPTYTCKECATDPTCVLCYECFINSPHSSHKYKMHTSMGGGYCDCGDPEAWSSDHACKLHRSPSEPNAADTDKFLISEEMASRMRNSCNVILSFATKILCTYETDEFPDIIDNNWVSENEKFATVLYNDETHTYETVIKTLVNSINCSQNQAMRLATIVDKEGRSLVRLDTSENCCDTRTQIERRTQKETNRRTQKSGPLGVKVCPSTLVALQNLAVRLLNWLCTQAQEISPLGEIISGVILAQCPSNCEKCNVEGHMDVDTVDTQSIVCNHQESSFCAKLMLIDRKLWKSARFAFHQLLMATALMDLSYKIKFGKIFVHFYRELIEEFIEDDHEHSISIVSMTVQIFTVPTIARRLITEDNVLEKILKVLIDFCEKRYLKESPYNEEITRLDFTDDSYPAILRRALYMFNDIGYLLTVIPKSEDWTNSLRLNFIRGVSSLLHFLKDIQGMDAVKRMTSEHQLMESEWETVFNIYLRMRGIFTMFNEWAKTDVNVHLKAFELTMFEILKEIRLMPEFMEPNRIVELNDSTAENLPFDVSRQPISIHIPLWRFLAGLFAAPREIMQYYTCAENDALSMPPSLDKPWDVSSPRPITWNLRDFQIILLEMPLRSIVLSAQCSAGMWRRNGFSLVNQVYNYSFALRSEMYDRDILLLQAVGAMSDPSNFLIRIIDRFGLTKWAKIGFEDASYGPNSSFDSPSLTTEESSKILVSLAEEMFQLLITLLIERFVPGVSSCTPNEVVQNEVVQYLCTGPKPFSQIEKSIPHNHSIHRISLESIVKLVSDFRKPTNTSTGHFHLKNAFLSSYNPYFYHYSRYLVSQAEQHQKKERANLSREMKACLPPVVPQFEPFFEPLLRIVESHTFINLLKIVFERSLKHSRYVSEGLLHKALFLTAIVINEQKRINNKGKSQQFFNYFMSEGIDQLLVKMERQDKQDIEAHADLIWWCNKELTILKNSYTGLEKDALVEQSLEKPVIDKDSQRTAIAARKRQLAMERMQKLQNSFKTQHMSIIDSDSYKNEVVGGSDYEDDDGNEILPTDSHFPICLGPTKTIITFGRMPKFICILCQENSVLSYATDPFVCSAFLQKSRLFSPNCSEQVNKRSPSSDSINLFSPVDVTQGIHISTCSHLMHYRCYQKYIEISNNRERTRRIGINLNARMLSPDAGEYQCPLCKRLSNCALPAFPSPQILSNVKKFSEDRSSEIESFSEWINNLENMLPCQPVLKKQARGHGRKRSHSERSLMDLTKLGSSPKNPAVEPSTSSSLANIPIAVSTPTGLELPEDTDPRPTPLASSFAPSISSFSEFLGIDDDHSVLSCLLNKKNENPNTNIPPALTNWETVEQFLTYVRENQTNSDQTKTPTLNSRFTDFLTANNRNNHNHLNEIVLIFNACSFLLRSVSSVLQVEKKPLFGAYNTRQRDCLTYFIRLTTIVSFNVQPHILRHFLAQILGILLIPSGKYPAGNITSNFDEVAKPQINLMEIDVLTLAVQMCICIGWTWENGERILYSEKPLRTSICKIPDGSIDELYVVRLTLLAHIFQVVCNESHPQRNITSSCEQPADRISEDNKAEVDKLIERIETLFKQSLSNRGLNLPLESQMDKAMFFTKLVDTTVQFLRPLAILYHTITQVPPPESLKDPSFDEFSPLCRYLGLPNTLLALLDGIEVESLFKSWSDHLPSDYDKSAPLTNLPVKINTLVDLPKDFSQLINSASNFRCPEVKDLTPSVTTICLICGAMVCSQGYCCQKIIDNNPHGGCQVHMHKCNNSTNGIYLRICDCQLLLLTSRMRGCMKHAPYVDEFGEYDFGFV